MTRREHEYRSSYSQSRFDTTIFPQCKQKSPEWLLNIETSSNSFWNVLHASCCVVLWLSACLDRDPSVLLSTTWTALSSCTGEAAAAAGLLLYDKSCWRGESVTHVLFFSHAAFLSQSDNAKNWTSPALLEKRQRYEISWSGTHLASRWITYYHLL